MSHCTCVAFALHCTRRCLCHTVRVLHLRYNVRGGVCVTLYEEVFASHCTRRCLCYTVRALHLRHTVRGGVCVTLYEEVFALHCTCVAFASHCTRRCLHYTVPVRRCLRCTVRVLHLRHNVRGGVCVTLYEEVSALHCTRRYLRHTVRMLHLRYTVRGVCVTLYEKLSALHCTRRCLRYTVRVLHLHHTVRGGVCITLYEEVFASHCTCVAFALHCTYEEVHQDTGLSEMCRDGQIQIYTVYIRYYLLGFREIYGHVRGTYKQFWPTSEMCFGLPLACMIAQL